MIIDPNDPLFGHAEAVAASGADPISLKNWVALGIVSAADAGGRKRRRYSLSDLVRVALVKELTDFGVSASRAGRLAENALRDFILDGENRSAVTLMISLRPENYVVVDPDTGEESRWSCTTYVGDLANVPFSRLTSGVSSVLFIPVGVIACRVERACKALVVKGGN